MDAQFRISLGQLCRRLRRRCRVPCLSLSAWTWERGAGFCFSLPLGLQIFIQIDLSVFHSRKMCCVQYSAGQINIVKGCVSRGFNHATFFGQHSILHSSLFMWMLDILQQSVSRLHDHQMEFSNAGASAVKTTKTYFATNFAT